MFDEKVCDSSRIDSIGHLGQNQNSPRIRREDETLSWHIVIVKRSHSEVITCTKQFLVSRITDGECEVAQQMVDTLVAPAKIGLQDKFGIAN
jgi:hypothetical protein